MRLPKGTKSLIETCGRRCSTGAAREAVVESDSEDQEVLEDMAEDVLAHVKKPQGKICGSIDERYREAERFYVPRRENLDLDSALAIFVPVDIVDQAIGRLAR